MAFYDKAASLLQTLFEKKGTIKSLVYKDDVPDKKRMFKLICEFLKYKEAVDTIIENSDILKEKALNLNLARVLIYEFLFAKGPSGNSKGKKVILKHQSRLQAELTKLKLLHKTTSNKDLIPQVLRNQLCLPTYVRVNTNKTTLNAVLLHFTTLGYKDLTDLNLTQNIPVKNIKVDKDIPNLLVLPHATDLHLDSLLLNGSIIIQDKASCFPAHILNPTKNSHVIDACAAPGNKTSHLSMLMRNTGKIFAFDADMRRLKTLITLTGRAACKNIEALCGNFLEVDTEDEKYGKVEMVLLDPSCSGSGIVGRLDHLTEHAGTTLNLTSSSTAESADNASEITKERLEALSEFQYLALTHAMRFKSVKRICYSTCSKYRRENEGVCERVLAENSGWRLVKGVMPGWTRRGLECCEGIDGDDMIRTLPEEDMTIGFFVALFEKI